jgi:hypothetical protein
MNEDEDDLQLGEEQNSADKVEELILIEHLLTQTEHKTIVQALKNFVNAALIPMTQKPTTVTLHALKKQKEIANNLLVSMSSFSDEIALTKNEYSILRRALQSFIRLPKPLWEDINQIRKIKSYQDTAANLLENLKL